MADDKKRVVQESFRKRRNNFLRRAHEIGAQYGANIYVLIHRQGKYYVYTSTLCASWPPPVEEVVIYFPTLPAYKANHWHGSVVIRQPRRHH